MRAKLWPKYGDKEDRLKRHGRIGEEPVKLIEEELKILVTKKLPKDLDELYGIEIRSRIIAVRYQSIALYFGIVLSAYTLLASYKDFAESIRLIRDHCREMVRALANDYDRTLQVGVEIMYPKLQDPELMYMPKRFLKLRDRLMPHMFESGGIMDTPATPRRDGFFWFLLILCILLLGALGTLVYAAVMKTYFG